MPQECVLSVSDQQWLFFHQGYNVVDVFRRLCLYTTDCQIRDTLSRVTDLLTYDELDALAFVRRLETFYPQRSFETAKRLHLHQNGLL